MAVGGGATILFHCDILYVGGSFRMRLPFTSLGIAPEFGSSYLLQASIGSRCAAELILTSEWVDAERAVETRIATRKFKDDELIGQAFVKGSRNGPVADGIPARSQKVPQTGSQGRHRGRSQG